MSSEVSPPYSSVVKRVERIPALDGLRGLAVVAVVVFHAWPRTVSGGWVGVSVFFTLSGYFITGIIIREHLVGDATPLDFWRRRGRRLLPAALLTLVGVVAGTAIVDVDSLREVTRDAFAALVYVHNWRAASAEGGYEAIFDTTLQPLAHMWSLSIEEQVYILWPPLLLLFGVRRALLGGLVVVVIATVLWWGSADSYFATPVRFGEVLTGAALAAWVAGGRRMWIPRSAALAAAAVLIWWTVTLEESSSLVFGGALPVIAVCSAVVVASIVGGGPTGPLEWRPMVWLGTRSYAIYLFHWPLLVLIEVPAVVALALTAALAEVSYRLVEMPIRTGKLMRHPFTTLATATVVVGALGSVVLWTAPKPASDEVVAAATAAALEEVSEAPSTTQPPPATSIDPAGTSTAPLESTSTTTVAPVTTTELVDTRIPLPPRPTVLVLGDSTGVALEPALQGWVDRLGGVLVSASEIACSPLFTSELLDVWSTVGVVEGDATVGVFEWFEGCRVTPEQGTDLVLVVDHGAVMFDHYNKLTQQWTSILDPVVRTTLSGAYEGLVADAAAAGALLVFLTPPQPYSGLEIAQHASADPARRVAYLDLVDALASLYDDVELLEVGSFIEADPDRYPRSDDLHLDSDVGAVNVVVDLVAPAFRIEEVS